MNRGDDSFLDGVDSFFEILGALLLMLLGFAVSLSLFLLKWGAIAFVVLWVWEAFFG